MKIEKVWAMPNGNTFTIKPIKEFVEKEVGLGGVIVDPFANSCKYGTITNDLNPEFETTHHLDALEFLKSLLSYGSRCRVFLINSFKYFLSIHSAITPHRLSRLGGHRLCNIHQALYFRLHTNKIS